MDTVVSRDGTRIAFACGGSGPPLVLVHGASATHARWAKVLPRLEAHFTVYAVERRGRGRSGDTPPYAMAREFEDIAAVMSAIAGPVDLLGHSYGAICSLEAAQRVPNLRRLVLYEPPIPTDARTMTPADAQRRLEEALARGDREGVLAIFFLEMNGMPPAQFEQFKTLPEWRNRIAAAHTVPREVRAVDAYRFEAARFAGLHAPVLLLLGGDSVPYFGAAIDAIAAALPNARKVVLPGQRHVAMDTAPDLFADEVLAFLTR